MVTKDNQVSPVLISQNIMSASLGDDTKIPVEDIEIPAGQVIEWFRDGEVSKFNLWKTAKVYEALTTSASLKVYKGHLFSVGDTIFVGASLTILAIDRTSDDYDIITLSATASVAVDVILYYRDDPETEGVLKFAFIKDAITIEDDQSLLSVPVSMGVLDNRILCSMIGFSATEAILPDSTYIKVALSA